jgi:sigma-B regulation protein RsbU (phosphoserine phosphatase)
LKFGPGQFLGLFSEPHLDEQCIALPADSLLVMFTDGVTEARGSDNEMFGEERLQAVLYAGRNPTAQAACEAVLAAVRAFGNYTPQRDDIAVIAVHVNTSITIGGLVLHAAPHAMLCPACAS